MESVCQSSGRASVPQPRCLRSRFESLGSHSSQSLVQPSNETSTLLAEVCTIRAGYQRSCTSSASMRLSSSSEPGRWTTSSLGRQPFGRPGGFFRGHSAASGSGVARFGMASWKSSYTLAV
eukprot:5724345-Prymnesium_polylepis.1